MTVDQLRRFLASLEGEITIQVGFEDMDLDVISVECDPDSDVITLWVAEPIQDYEKDVPETLSVVKPEEEDK